MVPIRSIRTQLTLLALAAVLPLLGLLVFEIRHNFDANSEGAKQAAAAHAREISARIDEIVGNVDALLNTVSHSLPLASADGKANDAVLSAIKAELPAYFNDIRVSARDGTALGHSEKAVTPVVQHKFFRDAVEQRRFAVGAANVGPGAPDWIVGFARPVFGKNGEVVAVASASIRMERVQQLLRVEGLSEATVVTVLDENGVVLVRSTGPAKLAGNSLAESGARHAQSGRSGAIEATDADGVARLSGSATAKRVPWMIQVGVPASEAYAVARATLGRAIWLAIICIAASALLASLVAARIATPLRRLQKDVTVLAAGDLSHRSHVVASGEIGRLAAAFNEMARALEAQEDAREHLLKRFEVVSRAANDVIWDWDLATDALWWSTSLQSVFGYRPDDINSHSESWYSRIHDDDTQRVQESIRRAIDAGAEAWNEEYRFRRADGSYADIHDRGYVLRDERGRGVRMIGAMQDVSARKRTVEELRASERRYRSLFDLTPLPIWVRASESLRFLEVNDAALKTYGYTREQFLSMTTWDIRPPEDFERYEDVLLNRHDAQTVARSRGRHRKKDGSVMDVEVTSHALTFNGLAARLTVVNDITERNRTEQALRDSEERLRTVANNVPALIGYIDSSQRYRYVNKTYEDWYARPASEYFGRTVREVIGEDMYRQLRPHFEAALRGETVTVERSTSGQEEERYARFTYAPHFDADGKVLGFYVLGYDITERRKAEDAIRELNVELERRVLERTAQLESANKELEAFSYSVSHDLRAPLRSIDGFSQALLEDYCAKLDEQGMDFLQRIRKSSQRMAQLIDDLLGLSRVTRTEMVRARVDLSMLACDIAGDLRKNEPARKVELVIAPGLAVNADPSLMRVALDNLFANAWKFSARVENAKIEFGETIWRGRQVYFIRDNGAGFDMAYAGKLFGAFQRLHHVTEFPGTGIGLATVQRIVRRHGGDVWAEAEVGKGATFYFSLGSR